MKTTLSAFGIHRSSLLCDLPLQAGGVPKSDISCNYIFSIRWVFQEHTSQWPLCGLFHLCIGMTLWNNPISTCCTSSNSCSDTFKTFSCWPANCHIPRWVFSNTVVCFLYLPFCYELWMWLHLGRKPSSQFQQAYDCRMSAVYLLSLISHTHAFLQPLLVCDTAISASTRGLLRYT